MVDSPSASPGSSDIIDSKPPRRKIVRIRVAERDAVLTLALFEGVEPSALTHAVVAWAGLRSERDFFLTTAGSRAAARNEEAAEPGAEPTVVPLSYAVPDGAVLLLQRVHRSHHHQPPLVVSTSNGHGEPLRLPVARDPAQMEEGRGGRPRMPSPRQAADGGAFVLERRSSSESQPGAFSGSEVPRPPPRAPLVSALRSRSTSSMDRMDEPLLGSRGPSRTRIDAPLLGSREASRIRIDAPPSPPESPPRRRWSFGAQRSSRQDSHGSLSGLSDDYASGQNTPDTFMSVAMVTAMERFNRLSTELANERTLLAYVRTSMASIRTAFTYLDLSAPGVWSPTIMLTEFLITAVMLLSTMTGVSRYFRLKAVIERKIPPRHFGRISLRPLSLLLFVACAVTATGLYTRMWQHG